MNRTSERPPKEKKGPPPEEDKGPPEDSIPLRSIVAAMAVICVATSCYFVHTNILLLLLYVWGALSGSFVSYQYRNEKNQWIHYTVVAGVFAVLFNFAHELVQGFDQGKFEVLAPIVHQVAGTFALHTFELKTRNDINISSALGLALICLTAPMGKGLIFGACVLVYVILGAIMLYYDCISRTLQAWVSHPPIAKAAVMADATPKRRRPRGSIILTIAFLPILSLAFFLFVPRGDRLVAQVAAIAKGYIEDPFADKEMEMPGKLPPDKPRSKYEPKREKLAPPEPKKRPLTPAELKKQQEEERKKKAEEERLKAEELRKQKEEEARRKAEELRNKKDEERKRLEEEKRRKEEEARKKKEEEERKKREEEARKREEEARKREEEARKREEERKKREEEARKREEERRKREEERKKKDPAKLSPEEKKRLEEQRKKDEEQRKKDEEARKRDEEARKREEEQRKKEEEERKKREAEEARRQKEEEARRKKEEEARKKKDEEEARRLKEEEAARKKKEDEEAAARKKKEEEEQRKQKKPVIKQEKQPKPNIVIDPAKADQGMALLDRAKNLDRLLFKVASNRTIYLRRFCYDTTDGRTWTMSDTQDLTEFTKPEKGPYDLSRAPALTVPKGFQSLPLDQDYSIEADMGNVIAAGWVPQKVEYAGKKITVDIYGTIRGSEEIKKGAKFKISSQLPIYNLDSLRKTRRLPDADEKKLQEAYKNYLQLPEDHSDDVTALAQKLGGDANWFTQAENICKYLRATCAYHSVEKQPDQNTINSFLLTNHAGDCEDFASAFVVMCRSVGIPARCVAGYAPGDVNALTGQREIKVKHSHAWGEAYIPGSGWVPFDPTPDGYMPAAAKEMSYDFDSLQKKIMNQPDRPEDPKAFKVTPLGVFATSFGLIIVAILAFFVIRALKALWDKWQTYMATLNPSTKLFLKVQKLMKKTFKVTRQPQDTPSDFNNRVRNAIDERMKLGQPVNNNISPTLTKFLEVYSSCYFGNKRQYKDLEKLSDDIHELVKNGKGR